MLKGGEVYAWIHRRMYERRPSSCYFYAHIGACKIEIRNAHAILLLLYHIREVVYNVTMTNNVRCA